MMMHDARMKSYYISAGEMNMDWIEVKATCMWCMLKVVQSKLHQVRISITFDKLATRGLETCNVLTLFGLLNSETNMMNCIRRLIFYYIR